MKSKGFSLIELMIALTIASIIILAVASIHQTSYSTYRHTTRQSDAQEAGRMANYLLAFDIRNAGYRACGPAPANRLRDPDFFLQGMNTRLQGWEVAPAEYFDPGEVKAGTDVIAITYAELINVGVVEPYMPTPSAAIHISTGSDIEQGDVLLITDCKKSDIFQVTASFDPQTSGTIGHGTGRVVDPGNAQKELSGVYEGDTQIYRLVTHLYYVSPKDVLMRLRMVKGSFVAEDLVGHITNLQFRYRVESGSDLWQYFDAPGVSDWSKARVVDFKVVTDFPLNPFTFRDNVQLRNEQS